MTCACGNAARYINERGELTCGICPIREGVDSIRIADVPALLAWARDFAHWRGADVAREILSIIGRKP